jgi:deoxyribose-phosphate aldolase
MKSLIPLIDHAVLHPTQTERDLAAACALGVRLGVFSVCVKPYFIPAAVKLLAGSRVHVSTVIAFPHGSAPPEIKAAEANWACAQGAKELDMVANIGRAIAGEWDAVEEDIRAVVEVGLAHGALTKVIFETDFLTGDQQQSDPQQGDQLKIELCRASERAGAAFVKTSTGFGFVKQPDGAYITRGATEHDISLMRRTCGPQVGVKASGGIRNLADARRLVALGASRLGTSATATIAAEEAAETKGKHFGDLAETTAVY